MELDVGAFDSSFRCHVSDSPPRPLPELQTREVQALPAGGQRELRRPSGANPASVATTENCAVYSLGIFRRVRIGLLQLATVAWKRARSQVIHRCKSQFQGVLARRICAGAALRVGTRPGLHARRILIVALCPPAPRVLLRVLRADLDTRRRAVVGLVADFARDGDFNKLGLPRRRVRLNWRLRFFKSRFVGRLARALFAAIAGGRTIDYPAICGW